ncbi:putative endopeptidase [Sphingomonas jejuensis]|uniref:Endopeptidase n=1 Tax=Sphingomonas jejuensis TaxID=904715 RepID=A0ABX0XHX3_9SPHN|nr:M13 family metallopeptidase [Sphingomonas jejuensis]NJC32938.1 putative endopeptidase [Sphingomonas jejuensis]
MAALALSTALVSLGACAAGAGTETASARTDARPQLGSFGVDTAGMDTTVLPGNDFNAFVNGGWDARTEIPADRARWGGFDVLRDLSDQRTRDMLQTVDGTASPSLRKAGDLYASFMDEAAIEARGAAPLQPALQAIAAIRTRADLATAIGNANRDRINVPVRVGVSIDAKNPDAYVVGMSQGGLGLPDRDYYLNTDNARYAAARTAYLGHVERMLTLAGIPDGAAKARAIMALETDIARVHWTRVESRQAERRYNPVAEAELPARFSGVDWNRLLTAARLNGQDRVIVSQPSAIEGISRLVGTVPIDTWQAYLAFHTIRSRASVLPQAFVNEDFAFTRALTDTPQLKDRWKRAVDFTNAGMGEAVGEAYVARYFPPEAKAKMDELVRNVLAAMNLRLQNLAWMAPETKAIAVQKLGSFTPKIGYPDKWRDYSGLQIDRGDAFGNLQSFIRFDYDYDVARLGRPVDRSEWRMTPQTVNAYANPTWNEIVFPAAILQPPFFDPNADPAVNYGAIGAVIGHEISHHFDDQGRKYDATGRLNEWWTPQDVARFKQYTDQVVQQYGAYEPLPGQHVNGELTLGENIADLAGLTVAYDAYRLSLDGGRAPVIDGYTGDQRFFLGFGQVWRSKARDSALQQQLATDPHTPGNFRPYVVRNLDAWYEAFNVQPGTRHYLTPQQRVRVW